MTNFKIAVISAHTSPMASPGGNKAGGLNVYVLELSRRLAELGYETDIFSRSTDPETPEVSELGPGLRAIHLEAGPQRYLGPEETYQYVGAFTEALKSFAERESLSYDLVHSHYWLSGLAGQELKEAWRVPHVTMFHTLGEIKNRASSRENESDLRIQSEDAIIANVDRVICATEQERELIASLYSADADKVSIIPLGVDLERFQPVDKDTARAALGLQNERIVLFVGRIEPLKGVDILINATAMLDSDVDCSVLIVGGDEESRAEVAQLQDLSREQGIENRVAFVGAIDRDKLPLYYSAADVCVVPSHYESFGLVALEAMASGLPVVASRVGGLTRTVKDGETGYLVPWLCPEPFAERIELLLENEPLRRNLGESAREAVYVYRWENVSGKVIELYEDLIGNARGSVATGAAGD